MAGEINPDPVPVSFGWVMGDGTWDARFYSFKRRVQVPRQPALTDIV